MANVKHKKTKKNFKNDQRSNGKAWKQGKPPAVREAEAKKKRDAKNAA